MTSASLGLAVTTFQSSRDVCIIGQHRVAMLDSGASQVFLARRLRARNIARHIPNHKSPKLGMTHFTCIRQGCLCVHWYVGACCPCTLWCAAVWEASAVVRLACVCSCVNLCVALPD